MTSFSPSSAARALGLLLLLAACGPAETPAPETLAQQDAISLITTSVATEALIEPITGTGTIAAARTTDLGPSVDGIIEAVMVRVGDRVAKDQVLFRTRDVEYRLKVQELEARVQLARAEDGNARANLARLSKLGQSGAASEARLEDAQARAKVAAAQLAVAESQLSQAQQSLADTIVVAPYDGVVVRRDVDEGRFMVSRFGGGGAMGGPAGVVQIMQINVVAAIVQVPEAMLPRVALGLPVEMDVAGAQGPVQGKVDVINDRVDPVTRGVEVRVAIDNPDYAIKPGTFVRARILPPGRQVLTLSRSAVMGGAEGRYVYVARDGAARRVSITTRDIDADRVEILSGLKAGDAVLSGPNLRRVYEGAPVVIGTAPQGPLAQQDRTP